MSSENYYSLGDEDVSAIGSFEEGSVHELIRTGSWDKVRNLLTQQDKEEIFSKHNFVLVASASGQKKKMNPLYVACGNPDIPYNTMKAIIDITSNNEQEKATTTTTTTTATTDFTKIMATALREACRSGSLRTVQLLLKRLPESSFRYEYNLYRKNPQVDNIFAVIYEDFSMKELIRSLKNYTAWHIPDSPTFRKNFTLEEKKAIPILKIFKRFSNEEKLPPITLMHVICGIRYTDTYPLKVIMKLLPDDISKKDPNGNLPLHIICQKMPYQRYLVLEREDGTIFRTMRLEREDGTIIRRRGPFQHFHRCYDSIIHNEKYNKYKTRDNAKEHIQFRSYQIDILIEACPASALVRGKDGRLPLHLAIENGYVWDNLKTLIDAAPEALLAKDGQKAGGLYPFMLAATSYSSLNQLDIIYKLLRLNPVAAKPGPTQLEKENFNLKRKVSILEQRVSNLEKELMECKKKRSDG